ncbi:MAG: SCO family protein [Hydrogenovibrio sp.]|uniref:SCO family protein n=1 Tax=Hydrogenovibrio sp. TaxID=2065821 RepID=UPI0028700633|nr:SCO family protein [Hydrogenovibrio sp.]MDR9500044.1 SCO family protein [Hydrogenovibrio sp.]
MSWLNPSYGVQLDKPAPDFTLRSMLGEPHALNQHRGRYVVLYFGYIHCDEVCHNQVGVMFNLNHQKPDALPVDFLFVTMDPERDTPEVLRRYFEQLGDNFYALMASSVKATQALANRYHAPFNHEPKTTNEGREDYEVTHPGFLYVIDPEGRLRYLYPNQHLRYDKILQDIERLENAKG